MRVYRVVKTLMVPITESVFDGCACMSGIKNVVETARMRGEEWVDWYYCSTTLEQACDWHESLLREGGEAYGIVELEVDVNMTSIGNNNHGHTLFHDEMVVHKSQLVKTNVTREYLVK